jgi:hypothetical protein
LISAEAYLVGDVERALERSEQLYSRSTLLLVGGVVMAFVGVGVFFVSLRDLNSQSPLFEAALDAGSPPKEAVAHGLLPNIPSSQIFMTFKASAMLIFIEAIAWFLLRQYRSLIEDYKSFYRYYMRRANYLASAKMAIENSDKDLIVSVVKTLLSEDLTGRLKKDETTEDLEGKKSVDQNFAESIVTKTAEFAQRAVGQGKS